MNDNFIKQVCILSVWSWGSSFLSPSLYTEKYINVLLFCNILYLWSKKSSVNQLSLIKMTVKMTLKVKHFMHSVITQYCVWNLAATICEQMWFCVILHGREGKVYATKINPCKQQQQQQKNKLWKDNWTVPSTLWCENLKSWQADIYLKCSLSCWC